MIEPNGVLITQYPLAKIGTSIHEDAWDKRKAALEEELCDDLPIRKLRASQLQYDFVSNQSGVHLFVYLVPSNQQMLPLWSSAQTTNDLFKEEVRLIQAAQERLPEAYQHALKSSVDPSKDLETVVRRRRLWKCRKDGYLWLPSKPEGEKFTYAAPSKQMPQAWIIKLRFKVTGIYKQRCRVAIREVLTPGGLPFPVAQSLLGPRLAHPRIIFRRQQALGEVATNLFGRSVDAGVLLEADGQIEFSWIDSSVDGISLTGLPIVV